MGGTNDVGGVDSSDSVTCWGFFFKLSSYAKPLPVWGFHDRRGNWHWDRLGLWGLQFSIKLDSLWPVWPPDPWSDGVNTNVTIALGQKDTCKCFFFGGGASVCYYRCHKREKKRIDRPLAVYVIVNQASVFVCLFFF